MPLQISDLKFQIGESVRNEVVKSRKPMKIVIPAKAGIQ
jgi:hypothetical protein